MSQTYSTRERDKGGNNVYSTRQSRVTMISTSPGPGGPAVYVRPPVPDVAPSPAIPAAPASDLPTVEFRYSLSGQGLPAADLLAPGGAGLVTVTGQPGGPLQVSGSITGLNSVWDPAVRPVLWLIHDLTVPADLAPADLALLPKGATGQGNQPGAVFTIDGNPPTYLIGPNTLSVAITPGNFTPVAGGNWQVAGVIDDRSNQAYHPLVALGPAALADINAALPSGTVAQILTDLLMRPATVHPELNPYTHFRDRLAAVTREILAAHPPALLHPLSFTRAAVTLEGTVRATSRLMPTRETCFLVALGRAGA